MENKCNKTPNNKYMDHVYCHSSEGKNYIRANNNASGNGGGTVAAGQDVFALLKENKQLKAMLILHLDLIQEQSDQLMSKDKVANSLREESESLKSKNLQLEAQVQELQKQLQRQIKRMAAGGGEVSTLPPPPLAKIQCKVESDTNLAQTAKTEETKYPKEEPAPKEQPEKGVKLVKKNYKIQGSSTTKPNGTEKTVDKKSPNIIGECNGKLISKIILHRVNTTGLHSPVSTASDSTSELEESTRRQADDGTKVSGNSTHKSGGTGRARANDDWYEMDDSNDETPVAKRTQAPSKLSAKIPPGAKPRKSMSCKSSASPVKTPTPSRGGKQMPLMLTHAPDLHSDESASCDSVAETEQNTTCIGSPSPSLSPKDIAKHHQQNLAQPSHTSHHHYAKPRRCGYISTTQRYCTRAWEDEEFNCDYELMKDDVSALRTDLPPVLEIPKWTEHEISASYCIEGTEDLSDDTFFKRHVKLELDEKRRKKWDVQQIREQRRIEKLKRRHCKDELQNAPDQQHMLSFYPPPDAIQMICYVNDLPVQAFGELIPKLSTNSDFMLPWLNSQNTSSTPGVFNFVATLSEVDVNTSSHQAQRQILNSSFVFMKKRRRQQSSSGAIANTRQRAANVAATAAATKTLVNTTTTAPSQSEGQPSTLTTNVNSSEATKN